SLSTSSPVTRGSFTRTSPLGDRNRTGDVQLGNFLSVISRHITSYHNSALTASDLASRSSRSVTSSHTIWASWAAGSGMRVMRHRQYAAGPGPGRVLGSRVCVLVSGGALSGTLALTAAYDVTAVSHTAKRT